MGSCFAIGTFLSLPKTEYLKKINDLVAEYTENNNLSIFTLGIPELQSYDMCKKGDKGESTGTAGKGIGLSKMKDVVGKVQWVLPH